MLLEISKVYFDIVGSFASHPQILVGLVGVGGGGVFKKLKYHSYCVTPYFDSHKKRIVSLKLSRNVPIEIDALSRE